MKTRIAVFSKTKSSWGGSFQYAKAVTEALAGLDPDSFEVRVWHEEDEEWEALCNRLGFAHFVLGQYLFPQQAVLTAQKLLDKLRTLDADDAAAREAVLACLQPFSTDAALDAYRPDLVISPQMGSPRYHDGAKHIGVIHDLMHRYEPAFPEVGAPEEVAERERLFRGIVSRCDAVLVDSRTGLLHVRECYRNAREEQLKILPFTAFDEITKCEPRQPGFPLPARFLLYPAQFWLHKNHVGLARAVARLKDELPDLVVVAAGNTAKNGYAAFMEIVKQEKLEERFILPGYVSVEELAWLYRHARALVMPTFFGPTNIPPLEAMALGCPVGVSGIYGMPEHYGSAALYFKPDDPADIAAVLRRLWTDDLLCGELKKKGLARARSYNTAAFNKQVRRIVKDVCGTAATPTISRVVHYPKISVVIPTYNRASMIGITLDSLLAQNYPPEQYEIIVCNNNSTDDTENLLAAYAAANPGRIVPLFEQRQGVHYARNRAAHVASGDILYYTDDDMAADPGILAAFALLFAEYPKVGSATGKVKPLWECEPPEWIVALCNNYLLSLLDLGEQEQSSPTDLGVFSCHQAMRREAFFAGGGFHPENTAGEWIGDGETGLNITIGALGYHFGYTPHAVTRHMIPPTRMTQDYLNKRLANQGNCDSYTDYRKYRFSPEQLLERLPLHAARAAVCRKTSQQQQAADDMRWHLSLSYVYYHMNRLRYEKRLIRDASWRALVLRDDWLDASLYSETSR